MSIGEYAINFDELSKFCPYERVDECSHCSKFENGLRPDSKHAIDYLEINLFSTFISRCKIYEDDIRQYKVSGGKGLKKDKGNVVSIIGGNNQTGRSKTTGRVFIKNGIEVV